MIHHVKKVLSIPKLSIGIALTMALVIGITSAVLHNKEQSERFSDIHADSVISSGDANHNSSQNLTLAFPIGGRIQKVSVKIGDKVKAGTVLASLDAENALGVLNQARASYNKLINGASTPDIDIAKTAFNNAKNSYATVVAQQKVLVANALSNLRNSGLVALPTVKDNTNTTTSSPVISGTYTGATEGTYTITVYSSGNGYYFSISGLENGSGIVSNVPVSLGTHGLYIQFPNNFIPTINTTWTVAIPNTQSPNYLSYYTAYQSALQTQSQAVTNAQGAVDSAQAALDQKIASARSEDIDFAKAQVQIAEGAYNNTLIVAPVDGTITNVSITAGQIATPNTPAIELLSK